jgi:cytochrome c oxidase subunit 2
MMIGSVTELTDRVYSHILPALHLSDKGLFSSVPDFAGRVHQSFYLILVISVVLLALVTFCMVFFAIRYRQKKNPIPREVKEPLMLEIAWTVIPTILVFIMFYVGWKNFVHLRTSPENALPVRVTARMWSWQFEYANGKTSSTLRIPLKQPVKLLMISEDVNHSLFIPDFRVKEDVVPGLETNLWFSAASTGEHDIFCTEYCGLGHSSMLSKVIVMGTEEFNRWYEAESVKKEAEADLLPVPEIVDEAGCLDCHSTDGSILVGPTFQGLFGKRETVITDGTEREVYVDENYLRRSILDPGSDVAKGYQNIMPSYEGELSEEEIQTIIQHVKKLK